MVLRKNYLIKTIFYKYVLIISLLLLTFIPSCKDNPVSTGGVTYDSARYKWQIDTFTTEIADICGLDTNNVFLLTPNTLMKYNGKNYTNYPLAAGMSAFCVGEVDNNNVYIGGGNIANHLPCINRWNGSTTENIPIIDSSNTMDIIKWIFAASANEIWFGTDLARLIKYDGSGFRIYNFDSTNSRHYTDDTLTWVIPLKKDISKGQYIETFYNYSNSSHTHGRTIVNIYINNNSNNWQRIYNWEKDDDEFFMFNINNELYGIDGNKTDIYKFNGANDFVNIINCPFEITYPLCGNGDEDLLINGLGFSQNLSPCSILSWNGTRWAKELIGFSDYFFKGIKLNSNYYCLASKHGVWWYYYFTIGRKE